ncbi:MAG: 4-hydroxy-tetrahydrodipicolinate reductase [Saprospiraceae bacterium]|nr:4-hydroxy-tetrahydrodipicolinate reductase [Saprospiraceae bacterium]
MSRIAIIGYGKMGQTIHKMALAKGHEVPLTIDVNTDHSLDDLDQSIDVAIEFTRPDSAFSNLKACLEKGIPVVCGTTGWLDNLDEIHQLCHTTKGAFFYASNYSVGVNIFFALSDYLAGRMDAFAEYEVDLKEIHHTQKLDAPSGTAITLAQGILKALDRKEQWIGQANGNSSDLVIQSERIEDTPGTHMITYKSEIDAIEIKHTAFSRKGFASGALTAAEWLIGKQGIFSMRDLLGF